MLVLRSQTIFAPATYQYPDYNQDIDKLPVHIWSGYARLRACLVERIAEI